MVGALLTMVVGILGAVAQSDIKRLLSFTLVSHIGYMVFGIALGSQAGLAGAVFYVAHHILIQTALFLAAGLVERQGGSSSLDRLGGLATSSPLLALLFFVPAMNLAGIPPLSGFIGKVGLLQAGAQDGGALAWTLVGAGAVVSLLTLYAVAKVWGKAFWRPLDQAPSLTGPEEDDDVDLGTSGSLLGRQRTGNRSRTMLASTAAMVAVTLSLTVAAGPLYALADRAATDLLARDPYLSAVLPEPGP
jgi:multicomponent Na+:H+ antiporter subunit D